MKRTSAKTTAGKTFFQKNTITHLYHTPDTQSVVTQSTHTHTHKRKSSFTCSHANLIKFPGQQSHKSRTLLNNFYILDYFSFKENHLLVNEPAGPNRASSITRLDLPYANERLNKRSVHVIIRPHNAIWIISAGDMNSNMCSRRCRQSVHGWVGGWVLCFVTGFDSQPHKATTWLTLRHCYVTIRHSSKHNKGELQKRNPPSTFSFHKHPSVNVFLEKIY